MGEAIIQAEQELAKDYSVELIPNTKPALVELSRTNVAIVEANIKNDSAYLRSSDASLGPITKKWGREKGKEDGGTTAYWMGKLKIVLINNVACSEEEYKRVITGAVCAVDRENSTHLNADKVGRDQMVERLLKIDRKTLVDYLKFPTSTKYELIGILSEPTDPKDGFKPRKNLSFASKFCQEACFYLFAGMEEQDNYSKYDYVVKSVLPRYLKYYGIQGFDEKKFEGKDREAYVHYQCAIDAIRGQLEDDKKISRNGFDHLLWYYFKGRLSRSKMRMVEWT